MSGQTYTENFTTENTEKICDRYLLAYLFYINIPYISYTKEQTGKIYFLFTKNSILENAMDTFSCKEVSLNMPKYIATIAYLKTLINQIQNG